MAEIEIPYVWINGTTVHGRADLREIRFKPAKGHEGARLVGHFSIANGGAITRDPHETVQYTREQLEALGEVKEEDE